MKIKTSELDGAQLDWAVAKCEGLECTEDMGLLVVEGADGYYVPSMKWEQAGPIIEREKLDAFWNADAEWWSVAGYDERADREVVMRDKSYLVAAMRCYVAQFAGDTVDIPEELV